MAFHVLLSLQSEKTLIEIIAGKKRNLLFIDFWTKFRESVF